MKKNVKKIISCRLNHFKMAFLDFLMLFVYANLKGSLHMAHKEHTYL